MQALVSSTVLQVTMRAGGRAMARYFAAAAKVEDTRRRRERACMLLAHLANRHQRKVYDVLAHPIREQKREAWAKHKAELKAEEEVRELVQKEMRQAELAYQERLKTDWRVWEKIELEKIAREKEQQARSVAAFYANKKRRVEAE